MSVSAKRKGSYGLDAPPVIAVFGILTALSLVGSILSHSVWNWIPTIFLAASGLSALFASRKGKFIVWARTLNGLDLKGDELVLDLGCGRGAVLLMVAEQLTTGRAVGVDLWRTVDQSGNDPAVTLANAEAEGVAEQVEVETGDIAALPFGDGFFDLVVSSLAIHNLHGSLRTKAVDEAYRVLAPGGRLLIADISAGAQYAKRLTELGAAGVKRRNLGPLMWWGGPWVSTSMVEASKPA